MLIVLVFHRLDYDCVVLPGTSLCTCFTLCCRLYCLVLGLGLLMVCFVTGWWVVV